MTLKIGLTGGIAGGKSTVSRYLREKGIPVVDADLVARNVVEPGTVGLQQICDTFGAEYLLPDGSLNRRKLGQTVFADRHALEQLNRITGPLILRQLQEKLANAGDIAVLDAALLLEEACYRDLVDCVWVVTASEDVRLERLMQRDGLKREDAWNRISSQMTEKERIAQADVVLDNNGTIEQLLQQVDFALQRIIRK